jgi:hypothetical protein
MRVFNPSIDKRYTDMCPYCCERLVVNPWDLDQFQELDYDSLGVCPNCGGQIQLCTEVSIEPLECCIDCERYWGTCCEYNTPCEKALANKDCNRDCSSCPDQYNSKKCKDAEWHELLSQAAAKDVAK